MCKLLIMTGITEPRVAETFMQLMAVPMSRNNRDGIGYTAVGSNGELFSERWLKNDQFLSTTDVMTPEIAKSLEGYVNRLPAGSLATNYSSHGDIDFSDVRTITMHTRFATCGREFANTHPFIYDDTSLIHNGTIRNAFTTHYSVGLDINKISTCDSEAALQTYLSSGVNLNPRKAKEWLDLLQGSWAFGILTRNEHSNRVLDVVRGSSFLYYMEIEGLGKVFTTDEKDAEAIVKDMNLSFIKQPAMVTYNEMYRYDAITGELLESVDIKPVYNYSGSSDYSSKNFGRQKTIGMSTTSNSHGFKSSQKQTALNIKRPGEALISLVDSLRDEPDFMAHVPDIFTKESTPKNLKIDFRKVKNYTADNIYPLIDRLEVFDMVFNKDYVNMYESFPTDVREYVRMVDTEQGCKSARSLIDALHAKRKQTVG